ncbi:tripartite tricarboxylate transporter substrate binding protein [Modicisalibacter luteus]|uniref:Tripartite tricarboxylate transporter substrate binding protein n=1 Tax=Modicisalibacter luteus TaxID=453962 RepID=A0ABV7M230_9GAMM|nr:tripartite tricarboxylate transporter substrate binding protein [Halomonas lutea]
MRLKTLTAALVAGITVSITPMMASADYSAAEEVKVLIGFKPGGGSDTLAQLVQPYLSESLGVNFVNEYLPGAAGAIAWTRLTTQSPKDGSVISVTNTPMLMTNYVMNDAISYRQDDFTPLANVVTDPAIIVVSNDSPFKTFADLKQAAEKKPGTVTVGNSGVGGDDHFSTLLVENKAGIEFKKVPFQGDSPSATAAMGGKIDASFNNVGTVYNQIEAGNLRALAVLANERLDILPDVPTLKEQGIDVVAGSSRGYSAPAGIPEEARKQLVAAFDKLATNEEFLAEAKKRALNVDLVTGQEYDQMFQDVESQVKEMWANMEASDSQK